MAYRVVVVGATGNVGREMLNILVEREFPLDEIAVVASSRSTGTEIDFGDSGRTLKVKNIEHFDFSGWDMALFAAGSEATKIHAPRAAAAGCTVIDNSSLYRMDASWLPHISRFPAPASRAWTNCSSRAATSLSATPTSP
jgi:aspartate-semialdehyde dehydrogenase